MRGMSAVRSTLEAANSARTLSLSGEDCNGTVSSYTKSGTNPYQTWHAVPSGTVPMGVVDGGHGVKVPSREP